MDKIILKNECAEFTAAICGAKPLSLIADGREWLAGYISPILFPVVGRVLNDEHIYNGKTYNMPLHGFAQKMDFIVEELTDTSVSLVLEANDETRAMYPFEFRLKVKYTLDGRKLTTSYTVQNTGENTMYYGIGSHIGFNITLPKEDYELIFNSDLENNSELTIRGNDPDLKNKVPLEGGKVAIKTEYFEQGAVIIGNHKATSYRLINKKEKTQITYNSTDFEYITIWSDVVSPFLCIEPWTYSGGHIKIKNTLSETKEISVLNSGEKKEYKYDITCEVIK